MLVLCDAPRLHLVCPQVHHQYEDGRCVRHVAGLAIHIHSHSGSSEGHEGDQHHTPGVQGGTEIPRCSEWGGSDAAFPPTRHAPQVGVDLEDHDVAQTALLCAGLVSYRHT